MTTTSPQISVRLARDLGIAVTDADGNGFISNGDILTTTRQDNTVFEVTIADDAAPNQVFKTALQAHNPNASAYRLADGSLFYAVGSDSFLIVEGNQNYLTQIQQPQPLISLKEDYNPKKKGNPDWGNYIKLTEKTYTAAPEANVITHEQTVMSTTSSCDSIVCKNVVDKLVLDTEDEKKAEKYLAYNDSLCATILDEDENSKCDEALVNIRIVVGYYNYYDPKATPVFESLMAYMGAFNANHMDRGVALSLVTAILKDKTDRASQADVLGRILKQGAIIDDLTSPTQ